jgi:hypothetical protein
MTVTIGIDVGKQADPTAIVVARPETRLEGDVSAQHFIIPYLSRITVGTPYPDIARRAAEIIRGVERRMLWEIANTHQIPVYLPEVAEKARDSIWVLVDATGVGQPVVDLLRELVPGVKMCAVVFTHGEHCSVTWRAAEGTMGKGFLVSRLQILIQAGRVHLPRGEEAEVLIEELRDYEMSISDKGVDTYGAFKVGSHDDLVTALGLATLLDHKPMRTIRSYQYS